MDGEADGMEKDSIPLEEVVHSFVGFAGEVIDRFTWNGVEYRARASDGVRFPITEIDLGDDRPYYSLVYPSLGLDFSCSEREDIRWVLLLALHALADLHRQGHVDPVLEEFDQLFTQAVADIESFRKVILEFVDRAGQAYADPIRWELQEKLQKSFTQAEVMGMLAVLELEGKLSSREGEFVPVRTYERRIYYKLAGASVEDRE
jgi:hypothetical protein